MRGRRRSTVRPSTATRRWCRCCCRSWPTPPWGTASRRRPWTWQRSMVGCRSVKTMFNTRWIKYEGQSRRKPFYSAALTIVLKSSGWLCWMMIPGQRCKAGPGISSLSLEKWMSVSSSWFFLIISNSSSGSGSKVDDWTAPELHHYYQLPLSSEEKLLIMSSSMWVTGKTVIISIDCVVAR